MSQEDVLARLRRLGREAEDARQADAAAVAPTVLDAPARSWRQGLRAEMPPWWWRLAFVALAFAAGAAAVVVSGIEAALPFLPAVLIPVALAPSRSIVGRPPRPKVALIDDTLGTHHGVRFGARRPVDTDAVVADAVAMVEEGAKLQATTYGSLGLGIVGASPTRRDRTEFQAELAQYREDVQRWVEDLEDWRERRAMTLDRRAVIHNDSRTDAERLRINVVFPRGSEDVEEIPEPPPPPRAPSLTSLRLSLPVVPDVALWPNTSTRLLARAVSGESMHWERLPAGTLRLVITRGVLVQHDDETTESFAVRLRPGDHEVRWDVTARNLPRPRRGAWRLVCDPRLAGSPIRTLQELKQDAGIVDDRDDTATDT